MKAIAVISFTCLLVCLAILVRTGYTQPTYKCRTDDGCNTECYHDPGICGDDVTPYNYLDNTTVRVSACTPTGPGCSMNVMLPYCYSVGYQNVNCQNIVCFLDTSLPQCSN